MSIVPLTLSGTSQYSSDLQSILNRAVQIAAIPITLLQNKDSDLIQRKTLLSSLSSGAASLAGSLEALGQVAAHQAISASSSNTSVVTVTGSSATIPASYTIDSVTSIATAASERSLISYADSASTPVSAGGTVRLTVGSDDYTFSLANNTLIGLRDKINSLGAGVTASILTTSDGNYLSVSAAASGETTLSLTEDPLGTPTDLLTATNQGTDAKFKLNGIDIVQKSNLVSNVVGGVTFRINATSTTATTISLSTDRTALSSALQTFVGNYNALHESLKAQTGSSAGLLSGSSIVGQLHSALRQISAFRGDSGTVKGLADLGITFDSKGTAKLDTAAFNALSDTNISDAFHYIGSESSKLGGLSAGLKQVSDPISGLIRMEQDGIDRTDRSIQAQIATLSERIENMQTALSRRLQDADALMARLEAQQKTINASLQGLNLVLYGKNQNQ